MQISEREKKLVIATVTAIIIGGGYILYGLWSNATPDSTISSTTALHFEDLLVKIENVESQKEQNMVYKRRIGNLNGQFVTENQTSQLIAELMDVARQSGFNVKSYDPNVNERANPLPVLEIRLVAESKYADFIKFLDNLRTCQYFLQPTNIRLSLIDKNKPDLNVQMTLFTYLLDKTYSGTASSLTITRNNNS